MKRKFTFLIAAAVMLLTIMATTGEMWGQTYTWQETSLSDMTTGDYVVIVGTSGSSTYAMSNNKSTSAAPVATAVTVSNGQLSGTIDATIQWVITATTTNNVTSYNFGVPNTSDYLYCTSTNNGVRVGTNKNKAFTFVSVTGQSSNYLFNTATSRYIGIYNQADWRCYISVNNNIKDQSFAFYKRVEVQTEDPYITADDVEIAYNATSGSIEYSVENSEGNVTAEITSGDWLTSLGTITASEVPFTCSANSTTVARTATVTLSFTDAEDKVVTITQAAAPLTTMDAIFAAATSAGSTATSVNITLNNWVVSGVSTNGKNVFVTDGTEGFVIFDNGGSMGFATNNILSGTVSCKVQLYNGFAEITQLNSTTTGISVTTGGTVSPADVEMADLTGVNTGALVHYENLTCSVDNNKYYLTDGTTTIQVYNAIYAFGSTLVAGHVYNITGVYQQFNAIKEILPRSADDIEVVETEVADPVFSPEAGTYAEAQTVTMSCTTEGAAIHYTTDGTEPDGNSTQYTEPISVSSTTTFKAKAIKGDDASAVATATYHICSAENPYTVTQALNFHEYPTSTIWVHGIVSTAPTAAPNNGQLTYYISDDGTNATQLQVYKGKGLNEASFTAQDDIQVGDIVTVTGIVKIYNSTKEFDAGNYLTSFERPVQPAITVNPTLVEAPAAETQGTLEVTYTAIETDLGASIYWYTDNTGNTATDQPDWIDAEINATTLNVDYVIGANTGDARTAYFKVYGLDAYANEIYSELVTITQEAYVAPTEYSITVAPDAVQVNYEEHDGYLAISYTGLEIEEADDFGVQFYEVNGTELTALTDDLTWIQAEPAIQAGQEGYFVYYYIGENDGAERSAYFKVYSMGGEDFVYSNLVTVTQEAYVDPTQDIVDVLNNEFTGITGTNYTGWSDKTGTSGAVYAGKSAGGNSSIQLRSNDNEAGIVVTTATTRVASKVEVTWNSNTQPGRTLNVYGKNSAYEAASDLYGDNAGTLIGTIVKDTSTELSISDEYNYIGLRSASGAMYLSEIKITWSVGGKTSISASDVEIAYDAQEGAITYTINNAPAQGGTLTAAIKEGTTTTIENFNLGDVTSQNVPFTCSANETATARTATVTLTYTYGINETATKDVTVTQEAAPVVYTTIPALFEAATSTATDVTVTFNDWVVSGVSTNGNNVFVTDNAGNGFVIFDNNGGLGQVYAVNDILSGTEVTCSLKKNAGYAQIAVDATALTISEGGNVNLSEIEMANLTGVNTGALVSYENLTCSVDNNKYYLSDGTTTLQVYNSLYADAYTTLEADKAYNITGVYQQYNSTLEILPRSAEDIVEVVVPTASIILTDSDSPSTPVDPYHIEFPSGNYGGFIDYVEYTNFQSTLEATDFHIEYFDSNSDPLDDDPDWIESLQVYAQEEQLRLLISVYANTTSDQRIAYFKVWAMNGEEKVYSDIVTLTQAGYVPPVVTENYELFSGDLEEGDYIIYYNGYAMKNEVKSNRLDCVTVTPEDDVIVTGDATIVWHIAPNGEYWTIYSADAVAYAASTGSKNQATLYSGTPDDYDNALWTASGTDTYEFENKARAAASNDPNNKWLRNNGTNGFACYSTSTGGALSLYKKADNSPKIKVTPALVEATAEETTGSLAVAITNMTVTTTDHLYADICDAEGNTINPKPEWVNDFEFQLENNTFSLNYHIDANTVEEERTLYFIVLGYDDEDTEEENPVYSNVITVTQEAYVAPVATITVAPTSVSAPAAGKEDWLAITLENIVITEQGGGTFDLVFCDNEGTPLPDQSEKPAWFDFEFAFNDVWSMPFTIHENTLTEARTLYFKVHATGDNGTTEADSELVTVTQAGFVVDYAILPFEWEGGTTAAFNALTGASTYGVGDYAESHGVYRMKLDSDGDYIQVKTDSQPGKVTIGVKMIGGVNTSYITVKASTDGQEFDDGEALEISGTSGSILTLETTRSFDADVRFVKMVFAKGSNVGVGPITITKFTTDPVIVAEDKEIACDATAGYIEYSITNPVDGGVLTANTTAEWLTIGTVGETVPFTCEANTEATAREATVTLTYTYGDSQTVTKDVTVTQAAYIIDYAEMPFDFDGGRADIETTNGLTQSGLDTDYGSSPKLKFKAQGTTVTLKLNAAPVSLSYDIKGNSFSGGQFDVEYSADGETYTNLVSYTELGNTQYVLHTDFDSNVRYIRWIYTTKVNGNVALGNIHATEHYDTYGDVIFDNLDLTASSESLIIHEGSVVTVTGTLINNSPDNLVIEDGGQLVHENTVSATLRKNTSAPSTWKDDEDAGWYLIATPAESTEIATAFTGTFDLYKYSEPDAMWYTWTGGASTFDNITRGNGYLHASQTGETASFAGEMIGTESSVTKDLVYTSTQSDDVRGFNLVGNPFTRNLTKGDMELNGNTLNVFYVINDAQHSKLTAIDNDSYEIKPGEGFFVQATAGSQQLVFNPTTKGMNSLNNGYIKIVAGNENGFDNAYIQLANGNTLRKMNIAEKTSVYVINEGDDYAAARVEELAGTMPVNFKAVEDGVYKITFSTKDIEANSLYLIDNLTGETIDLMLEPTYSFEAAADDSEYRFTLVFDCNNNTGVDENTTSSTFAYQTGDEIFVNGNGTLQVFDVMGRFVTSMKVNGNERISTSQFNTGVYVFRMVGETIKTQKLIVR